MPKPMISTNIVATTVVVKNAFDKFIEGTNHIELWLNQLS